MANIAWLYVFQKTASVAYFVQLAWRTSAVRHFGYEATALTTVEVIQYEVPYPSISSVAEQHARQWLRPFLRAVLGLRRVARIRRR